MYRTSSESLSPTNTSSWANKSKLIVHKLYGRMEHFSSTQVQRWLRENLFEEEAASIFVKFDGKALLNVTEAGIMSLVPGVEGIRLFALLACEKEETQSTIGKEEISLVCLGGVWSRFYLWMFVDRRLSLKIADSVFALATVTEDGAQLSGNCFAAGTTRIATAYHNMYDKMTA